MADLASTHWIPGPQEGMECGSAEQLYVAINSYPSRSPINPASVPQNRQSL
jgi:hypothetical protein